MNKFAKPYCALVLGGYVNGYSIIRELYDNNIREIILFSLSRCLAGYSNKIKRHIVINKDVKSLYNEITKLNREYKKIIIFPTSDLYLEYLYKLYKDINDFCFVPFNQKNFLESSDKYIQYLYCKKINIPYPKTISIDKLEDMEKILLITFPLIIKPKKREDLKKSVFRNIVLNNLDEFKKSKNILKKFLLEDVKFLASEIIPGDSSNLYTYVGYRDKRGNILNEWAGKKLSSFPNEFGVFSSATNQAPFEVIKQSRLLLNSMNLFGVCCPEFKYDIRDNTYKLMEVNLRYMMWNRMGHLLGVDIAYTEYLDAIGKKIIKTQNKDNRNIHFVYFKHEILNLVRRNKYFKKFIKNNFYSYKTYYAIFDMKDLKPFIFDSKNTLKALLAVLYKIFFKNICSRKK